MMSRWRDECLGSCGVCPLCEDGPIDGRYVTVGPVRYGVRFGAVSPPPPGAGPRYRTQCCWPSASGPGCRIPLLAAPINSFDIISCANRVRIAEEATSDLAQHHQHDHVFYSTKCLVKGQFKRCALVKPQVYTRLYEHQDEHTVNLDRLPRFRFGGNRATSAKVRDNELRLRELADRFKRTPVPPPRTRHPINKPQTAANCDDSGSSSRVTPLRSASFSQVEYSADDKKYVRRRQPLNHQQEEAADNYSREVATLPRSKNLPNRCNVSTTNSIHSNLDTLYDILNPDKETGVQQSRSIDVPERDHDEKLQRPPIVRSNTISVTPSSAPATMTKPTTNIQEKKRDKSRRRKGIYISQWPNEYQTNDSVIPQFVQDGDFAACSETNSRLLQDSLAEIKKLQVAESDGNRDLSQWTSPQEEPLSPDELGAPIDWPYSRSHQGMQGIDGRSNTLKVMSGYHLCRSDSLSEGEPDSIAERKSELLTLVASDASDCESRMNLGSDNTAPRRYSKRPLRGPYGQMLEAEMKKPETGRKNQLNPDLKFLEDLSSAHNSPDRERESKKAPRSRSSCTADEVAAKGGTIPKIIAPHPLSKRKVSADSLVGAEGDQAKLMVSHQRTTSSPSKLEGFNQAEGSSELLQQLLRGSSEQLLGAEACLQQKNDTRTHVVIELYDNETVYVESLQIIVKKYLEPLKSPDNANLLDPALVDEIFHQIPLLLKYHEGFLEDMRNRLERWDTKQKIGDVFLEMFSNPAVLETYTSYVNNWIRVRDLLKSAQQSKPAFAKFLETTSREHKGKLALDSLLIKPIQKFPKYELLLGRLIKHTDLVHPDHDLLMAAQHEVHDQLLKINCTEREALEQEQLRELEGLIDGLIELVSTDRQYLRHDFVSMAARGSNRKERALFLFSDLLIITSIKRRTGTIRKPTLGQASALTNFEANKYKLLMKIALEDLEIVKSKDENLKQIMIEIEHLTEDIAVLNHINEIAWTLHCNHSQLDDLIKEMLSSLNKQLLEQQNTDSQLSCLDLSLNTSHGLENVSIVFTKPEKRASWEDSFLEAKHKLAVSGDRRPSPELLATVPIRKTRAGLQFTCAAPTLGDNGKDVWVCNSDGYVGQVCVLSLQPEPTVTSCNGVCNARILCVASVPGVSYRAISGRDEGEEHKTIQFDSSSSSDEDDKSDEEADECQKGVDTADTSSLDLDDIDSQQSTMWLGTEDGCIHVYNSSDNIRIKKNKIRVQHGSPILCIIYIDNRVFISLASGEIAIYERDCAGGGGWNINSPTSILVGSSGAPVTKMLPNGGRLWCTCGNSIKIFNPQTLNIENTITVNNDNNKPISCLVLFGNGVWLSLQNSAIVKCFHTQTFELLCEVNVAPAVTKMLTSCDDIIRQHKAACLRVTALLACKDLLWIGTSAGVLLTMPLPHITMATTKLAIVPSVTGVGHGHTGHVRFLTQVECGHGIEPQPHNHYHHHHYHHHHRNSYKGKPEQRTTPRLLVISGGDGYEDFRSTNISEVAGREDSTNHLLLWNV